jgi:hypothetical protein
MFINRYRKEHFTQPDLSSALQTAEIIQSDCSKDIQNSVGLFKNMVCEDNVYYNINNQYINNSSNLKNDWDIMYAIPRKKSGVYKTSSDECGSPEDDYSATLNCDRLVLDKCVDNYGQLSIVGGSPMDSNGMHVCAFTNCKTYCDNVDYCWRSNDIKQEINRITIKTNCMDAKMNDTMPDDCLVNVNSNMCPDRKYFYYSRTDDSINSNDIIDGYYVKSIKKIDEDTYKCLYTTNIQNQLFDTRYDASNHCLEKQESVTCYYESEDRVYDRTVHYLNKSQCSYGSNVNCIKNIDDTCGYSNTYYKLTDTTFEGFDKIDTYGTVDVKTTLIENPINGLLQCGVREQIMYDHEYLSNLDCTEKNSRCFNFDSSNIQEMGGELFGNNRCIFRDCLSYASASNESHLRGLRNIEIKTNYDIAQNNITMLDTLYSVVSSSGTTDLSANGYLDTNANALAVSAQLNTEDIVSVMDYGVLNHLHSWSETVGTKLNNWCENKHSIGGVLLEGEYCEANCAGVGNTPQDGGWYPGNRIINSNGLQWMSTNDTLIEFKDITIQKYCSTVNSTPSSTPSFEKVRKHYNLEINDAEKVFIDHWYSKAVSYISPFGAFPKQGMLIERILHFGYISFYINFESYTEDVQYTISDVVAKFKGVVDKWFSWMRLDIKVVLFGVRYASNISGQILDLDTYNLFPWQKIEVEKEEENNEFNQFNPWGTECGYFSGYAQNTFKSLQDTLGSVCVRSPTLSNPNHVSTGRRGSIRNGPPQRGARRRSEWSRSTFVGAEVSHHDVVFSIKGGGWTAHGQPQYLRLDHGAYLRNDVVAQVFGHSLSFDDLYDDEKYPESLYKDGFEHKKEDIRSIMDSVDYVTHMDKAMLLMAMEMSDVLEPLSNELPIEPIK